MSPPLSLTASISLVVIVSWNWYQKSSDWTVIRRFLALAQSLSKVKSCWDCSDFSMMKISQLEQMQIRSEQYFRAKTFSSSSSEKSCEHCSTKWLRRVEMQWMVDLRNAMSFSGSPLRACSRLVCSRAFAYFEFDNNLLRIVTALPKNASEDDSREKSNYIKLSFGTKLSVE